MSSILTFFFIYKFSGIKWKIMSPDAFIDAPCHNHDILLSFMALSLNELTITVLHLKRSTVQALHLQWPLNFSMMYWMWLALGWSIIITSSLSSGCIPVYLKTACVQPLIKKCGLIPSQCSIYRPISELPFFFFSCKAPWEDCFSTKSSKHWDKT